jgi:hypothetical protein
VGFVDHDQPAGLRRSVVGQKRVVRENARADVDRSERLAPLLDERGGDDELTAG